MYVWERIVCCFESGVFEFEYNILHFYIFLITYSFVFLISLGGGHHIFFLKLKWYDMKYKNQFRFCTFFRQITRAVIMPLKALYHLRESFQINVSSEEEYAHPYQPNQTFSTLQSDVSLTFILVILIYKLSQSFYHFLFPSEVTLLFI